MTSPRESAGAFRQSRLAQCLSRPAKRYSFVDHGGTNASPAGYFRNGKGASPYFKRSTGAGLPWVSRRPAFPFAAILALLRTRCPSDISGLIVERIVYPVDGHGGIWGPSNILKKCGKALFPAITYSDSAGSVVFKRFDLWIKAALFHLVPSTIFLSRLFSASTTSFFMSLASKTPATLGVAGSQRAREDKRFVAAITTTEPPKKYASMWALMRNDQLPVSSAS